MHVLSSDNTRSHAHIVPVPGRRTCVLVGLKMGIWLSILAPLAPAPVLLPAPAAPAAVVPHLVMGAVWRWWASALLSPPLGAASWVRASPRLDARLWQGARSVGCTQGPRCAGCARARCTSEQVTCQQMGDSP